MADDKVDTAGELAAAQANLEKAKAAHEQAQQADLENRTREELIYDWIEAVTYRMGNRPELESIVKKLRKQYEPKE